MISIPYFTKQCTKCKTLKTFSMFDKQKSKKSGFCSHCKECRQLYIIANKEKIINQRREHYLLNKDRLNEKSRDYRSAHRDKMVEQCRDYYVANREKLLQQKKEYYISSNDMILEYRAINKERISERAKQYRKTDRGKAIVKNLQHKRRVLTKQGDVTANQIVGLQQTAKTCYWCNNSLKNKEVHIDHYNPIAKGGEHTLSNLVVSCKRCNQRKHAKDPIKFANSIGKLL